MKWLQRALALTDAEAAMVDRTNAALVYEPGDCGPVLLLARSREWHGQSAIPVTRRVVRVLELVGAEPAWVGEVPLRIETRH